MSDSKPRVPTEISICRNAGCKFNELNNWRNKDCSCQFKYITVDSMGRCELMENAGKGEMLRSGFGDLPEDFHDKAVGEHVTTVYRTGIINCPDTVVDFTPKWRKDNNFIPDTIIVIKNPHDSFMVCKCVLSDDWVAGDRVPFEFVSLNAPDIIYQENNIQGWFQLPNYDLEE